MNFTRFIQRAAHSPFGLLLVFGAIASLIQTTVTGLPIWAVVLLFLAGVLGIAIGGAGVGLTLGRSDTEERATIAESAVITLRNAARLTKTRLGSPYRTMSKNYRALAITRGELEATRIELLARVDAGKVDWAEVDKVLAVLSKDLDNQLRDVDHAQAEWSGLVSLEETARIQVGTSLRGSEIDRR